MQLVAGFGIRPGLLTHEVDGGLVELAEFVGRLHVETAAREHRLCPALLERCVVEECVGPGIQHFMAQRRWLRRVARDERELPCVHPFEHPLQPREVHGFEQAVSDRLIHERVIGNLPVTDQVLGTSELIGEHGRNEVLGFHALQRRRHLPAASEPQHRQRTRRVPAPARSEYRRVEHRLHQQVLRGRGLQVLENVFERETVLWPE